MKTAGVIRALIGLCSVKCVCDVLKRYHSQQLAIRNFTTITAISRQRYVEHDTEPKIRSSHGRDQLTKGHVKALQECGVQPLTQYSTVGATTLQGNIMILLCTSLIISFSLLVLVVIHIDAYHNVISILVEL